MLAAALLLTAGAFAQTAPEPPSSAVIANDQFETTLTSFQTWQGNGANHYATFTLHFKNVSNKPLILACSQGTVSATDEQANKY